MTKRLRVFAGPNGSGKSTVQARVSVNYDIGHFVNADNIERLLHQDKSISFNDFDIVVSPKELSSAFAESGFNEKVNLSILGKSISLRHNVLKIKKDVDQYGYLGAILSEVIRNKLLASNKDFSFETVMSHPGKLDFLKNAKLKGFKTYLYFVATESVTINIGRVQTRVQRGGHDVPQNKIISRYRKSLELLAQAVESVDRAFIIDNSNGNRMLLLAEKDDDEIMVYGNDIPEWLDHYLINKLVPFR